MGERLFVRACPSTACHGNTFCIVHNYKQERLIYLGLFLDCLRHSWKQSFFCHNCRIFSSSEGKLMDSGTGSTMASAKNRNQIRKSIHEKEETEMHHILRVTKSPWWFFFVFFPTNYYPLKYQWLALIQINDPRLSHTFIDPKCYV